MEYVDVKGLRIAYRRAGKGPPLVLLHGGPLDGREWRRQLNGLSDEFTVVAWDGPGSGQSSDPPETFRHPDYAHTLAAFIQTLGLGRPHVCGLSSGGGLALELYCQYPAVPRSLVLASAYAGWAGSLPPNVVKQRLEQALCEADMPPEHLVRTWVPTFFSESVAPEVVEEVTAIVSEFHPIGIKVIVRAFAEADLRKVLPLIKVPTLLLYGDKDVRSPPNVAEGLHVNIPGSKLVIIPGVGHVHDMEAPERFNWEVRNFLRFVESSGAVGT